MSGDVAGAYRSQLLAAIDALLIRSLTSYAWLGQIFEAGPREIAADGRSGDAWLRDRLHPRLYADFYLPGAPAPASGPNRWRPDGGNDALAQRFSAANTGRGEVQADWRLSGRDGNRIRVSRDGLDMWIEEAEEQGLGSAPAGLVSVLVPKDRLGTGESFYTMFGDRGRGVDAEQVDRFYWHLRPSDAEELVAATSGTLNGDGLPFRMKIARDGHGFLRCDTAVLYTPRRLRERIVPAVGVIHRRVAGRLRARVPTLTRPLAPGLGFAEDPGGGESFGSHRCRILADSLVAAWRAGQGSADGRLRHVLGGFAREGLDPDRPYLCAGSKDPPALHDR